ncbi:MAG: hypothetical protein JXX14_09510 [Deltaproteobacteria bacterium]|nr:hypothetical protein [Deltaproteobacteria bacterium]
MKRSELFFFDMMAATGLMPLFSEFPVALAALSEVAVGAVSVELPQQMFEKIQTRIEKV